MNKHHQILAIILMLLPLSSAAMEPDRRALLRTKYENLIKERLAQGLSGDALAECAEGDIRSLPSNLIIHNFLDLLKLLLENNVAPNKRYIGIYSFSFEGIGFWLKEYPIHVAAEQRNLEALKMLVSFGACVTVEEPRRCNMTALHYVARNTISIQKPLLEIVTFLLNSKADPNARDEFGYTPLMCLSGKESWATKPAAREIEKSIAEVLIQRGADITLKSFDNCPDERKRITALKIAITARKDHIINVIAQAIRAKDQLVQKQKEKTEPFYLIHQ